MFRTRAGNSGMEALRDLKNLAVVKLDYTAVDDKGLESLRAFRICASSAWIRPALPTRARRC